MAKLLAQHFARDDRVDIAQTRQCVYLRLDDKVYHLTAESIAAIDDARDPVGAGKRFMATMDPTPKPRKRAKGRTSIIPGVQVRIRHRRG
ncbi:hypothetical protein [Mesorhizobium sp. M0800]|uniref:hypothetical protein n=1 Tax=Mesorhizobium sp. M0800 TaxID=2957000 RepID=UPI00333A2214